MRAAFEGVFGVGAWHWCRTFGRLLLSGSVLVAAFASGCGSDAQHSTQSRGKCAAAGAPASAGAAASGGPVASGGAAAVGGALEAAGAPAAAGGSLEAAGAATILSGCGDSGGNDDMGASGGSAGESAGAAGTAGGTSTAMWTMNAGKYQLNLGSTFLEIDPANGARITALRVGGETGGNLVADATVTGEDDNWGSTFWPSPQTWPWPPTDLASIAAINTLPYVAVLNEAANTLTLTSSLNTAVPMLQVSKKFSVDTAREAIQIDYTVTNGGSAAVTTAPWEVTRVPPRGITFYPFASEPFYQGGQPLKTHDIAGVTWYQHDPADDKLKLFADGKDGWIAHAEGDLLLIKTFPDIAQSQAAPNEAEIEIYAAPMYEEMETQGALQTLAMGESLHWTVRWYARKLSAPAAVGSAALVAYVQNQIK